MNDPTLLVLDAAINLLLGVLLIAFPRGLVEALGLPASDVAFYPSILGAVLFGIGIALLLERFQVSGRGSGLGLLGAVSINVTAGIVLAAWLAGGSLALRARGYILLWSLVAILLGISGFELAARLNLQR